MAELHPLTPEQARGADPACNAWVVASAGAGKTQLLTARMLRLLLAGVAPERLLALTFTKAAAAEMVNRLTGRLARWATAPADAVAAELHALEAAHDGAAVRHARALFATVLDAAGGLPVRTLHAHASGLIAAFPVEAGVDPGFELIEDAEAKRIARAALEAVVTGGDGGLRADLAVMARRHGEAGAMTAVATLLANADAIAALGPPDAIEGRLRALLGVADEGGADALFAAALAPDAFECRDLRRFSAILSGASTKTAPVVADAIATWLEADGKERAAGFGALASVFRTQKDEPRLKIAPAALRAAVAECVPLEARLQTQIGELYDLRARLQLAELAAAHLRVGQAVGARAAALKGVSGGLTHDEVITRAAALLAGEGAGEWVRRKLDAGTDHLLIDEAQDTSSAQWAIARALSAEFFAGEGARGGRRSLFAVGDPKQSIFGFQGAAPALFSEERTRLAALGAEVRDVPLTRNYRSVPAVLDVVDAVLTAAGADGLGLPAAADAHVAARAGLPGAVTLWPPVPADADDADDASDDADGGEAVEERGWVSSAERTMARRLAEQIHAWLDAPLMLPARGRALAAGDILVLVRKRRELIAALVAALQERGVPVAGADRLRLTAALAVKDLMSLMRFVLAPADDLSLAEVLVSPLVGWPHEALAALATGRPGTLWAALNAAAAGGAADAAEALAWLGPVLAAADRGAPSAWLEAVLSGPARGRARLVARLGAQALGPVEELVSAALAWERRGASSLRGFLAELEASDADLKRDPDAASTEVRIMTIHAAKGLQAPLVVLADAAQANAARADPFVLVEVDGAMVPIFHGGAAGKLGVVGDACAAATLAGAAEERRLLYVALTRAEDLLFVGGACGKKDKNGANTKSWHAEVAGAMRALDAAVVRDACWGDGALVHAPRATAAPPPVAASARAVAARPGVPAWASRSAPAEAVPPRPLSPSRPAGEEPARPPGGVSAAAARGRLLHRLFERLPSVAAAERRALALRLIAAGAPSLDAAAAEAIARDALGVIEAPEYAAIFGPYALAEAPLTARVGDLVIAGTVDRLLITSTQVTAIDFKTGARAPATLDAVPPAHVAQMAGYAAALQRIFPGRTVAAGLLYTAAPRLWWLPPALLAAHAPG